MLGEVLFCHLKEEADGERQGCYSQRQVGENEGQCLNCQGYDSWKEKEMLGFGNNPKILWKLFWKCDTQFVHTRSGSVFSPCINCCIVPVFGYFSLDALWHFLLKWGSFQLFCGLPTQNHGHEVNQNAVDWLCDKRPNTVDHHRYYPCCVCQNTAKKNSKLKHLVHKSRNRDFWKGKKKPK